jgi:hypothetical protein
MEEFADGDLVSGPHFPDVRFGGLSPAKERRKYWH